MLKKVLILVGAILGAAVLGLVLGEITVDQTLPALPEDSPVEIVGQARPKPAKASPYAPDPQAPPLWIHAGATTEEGWEVFLREVEMAAAKNLHGFVVPFVLPWNGSDPNDSLELLRRFVEIDPQATFLLTLDLNPPETWFLNHPTSQARPGDVKKPYPSPCSTDWHVESRAHVQELLRVIQGSEYGERVKGVVLTALENGRWILEGGDDTSIVAREAFSEWLGKYYPDDETLQQLWGDKDVTRATAKLPELNAAPKQWYTVLPQDQSLVDWRRFISDSVADAIMALTTAIKTDFGSDFKVYARYGATFEAAHPASGHFALGLLLGSDLDGIMSPVSFSGRGSGSAGGLMGPAHSALVHGKVWFLIDDTRTGVARDPLTGSIQRLEGMRAEDVANVQMRNFSLAITQDLGLVWSDPRAEGWLHATEQWELFALFDKRYREHVARAAAAEEGPPMEAAPEAAQEEPPPVTPEGEEESPEGSEAETDAEGAIEGEAEVVTQSFVVSGDPMGLGLVIVVDEEGRFYTNPQATKDSVLLDQARDALLQVGVQTKICLLQDMLDGFAPEAPVYAFLNLVHLGAEDRARLHEILAAQGASAIWHYAPGILDERASSHNVSETVGMDVERFDKPHQAGSIFSLGGAWLGQNEAFGRRDVWDPLFYIVDENADALAFYEEGAKPSAALRTLETGWTSVYIAEPVLTPAFLREVFRILEQPILVVPSRRNYFDTIYAGDDLIGIHSSQLGERTLELGNFYDIQDLFDPNIGWQNRDSFVLPMKQGETRLLELSDPSTG